MRLEKRKIGIRIDDMTYGCKLITKDNNRLKSLNSKCAVTVAIIYLRVLVTGEQSLRYIDTQNPRLLR